jgi:hypothetical protein
MSDASNAANLGRGSARAGQPLCHRLGRGRHLRTLRPHRHSVPAARTATARGPAVGSASRGQRGLARSSRGPPSKGRDLAARGSSDGHDRQSQAAGARRGAVQAELHLVPRRRRARRRSRGGHAQSQAAQLHPVRQVDARLRITDIFTTITIGVKGTGMAPFDFIVPADRMALVHYVRSLGSFDHGPEDAKATEDLATAVPLQGRPHSQPHSRQHGHQEDGARTDAGARAQAAGPRRQVARAELLRAVIADPARAARTVAATTDRIRSPGRGARLGRRAPGNGFAPALAGMSSGRMAGNQPRAAGRRGCGAGPKRSRLSNHEDPACHLSPARAASAPGLGRNAIRARAARRGRGRETGPNGAARPHAGRRARRARVPAQPARQADPAHAQLLPLLGAVHAAAQRRGRAALRAPTKFQARISRF